MEIPGEKWRSLPLTSCITIEKNNQQDTLILGPAVMIFD